MGYENQRDMVAGQQFNIEQASFCVQSARANEQMIAAMAGANNDIKRTLKNECNINHVEDLYDDVAEIVDDFHEINEALGRNFATPYDIDEADLDAELELLEDELFEEEVGETSNATPSYLQGSKMTSASAKTLRTSNKSSLVSV